MGIEDKIRIKERNQEFDKEFLELARSVYKNFQKSYNNKQLVKLLKQHVLLDIQTHQYQIILISVHIMIFQRIL